MTKIIGLTGGIGSGKTTIAKHIQSLGIPVYIADDEAKKILELPEIANEINEVFGDVVFEYGKLSREKLAEIVFNNPQQLEKLNQIVHPAVRLHFDDWFKKQTQFDIVVKEAAILFESGSYKDCDVIISISAPLETRIQRVLKRDKSDIENVMNRVKNQWTDEMRAEKSDYVIENLNVKIAISQIDAILEEIAKK